MRTPRRLIIAVATAATALVASSGALATAVPASSSGSTGGSSGPHSGAVTSGTGSRTSNGPTVKVFGVDTAPGGTVAAFDAATNVHFSNMTVSTTATNGLCTGLGSMTACVQTANISGSATFGSDSAHPMAFTMAYQLQGRNNLVWTATLSATPAGASYQQASGTLFSLNNVSGTLTRDVTGAVTTSLQVTGMGYRGQTFTGTVVPSSGGLQASGDVAGMPLSSGGSAGALVVSGLSTATASTAQPQVRFGSSGTPANVSLSWTDLNHWTITLARGNATGTAPSGAAFDVNNASGTITRSGSAMSGSLSLTGAVVGDQTFDLTMALSSSGFQATISASEVTLAGGYRIDNPSITVDSTTHSASLSGKLETSGTTVDVNAGYTDSNDWNIQIQANSAGSGYHATGAISVNNLSGNITDSGGHVSFQCTISGVGLGDATFDMSATVDGSGVSASAVLDDVTIGGFKFTQVSVSASTSSPAFSIQGGLSTDAGSFDANVSATALSGGGYSLTIGVDGADLSVGTSNFYLQSFGFSWTGTAPASGCASMSAKASGTLVMGNNTFSLNDISIGLSCQTITEFEMSVTVSHTAGFDITKTETGILTIAWSSQPGSYTPQYSADGKFTGPTVNYANGFFGTLALSQTRGLTMSYGRNSPWPDFSRSITIGLGFSVELYHQQTASGGVGAATGAVQVAGYVDADRVSGGVVCTFQAAPGTDFTCSADMDINPEHAGHWHKTWTDL